MQRNNRCRQTTSKEIKEIKPEKRLASTGFETRDTQTLNPHFGSEAEFITVILFVVLKICMIVRTIRY